MATESRNLKLLLLTDWFAPGYKAGGPIRSTVNFVQHLAPFFDIHILTTDRDLNEPQAYPDIPVNQWIHYDQKAKICYLSPDQLTIGKISAMIEDVQPDTLYLNSMFSKSFTIFPLWWVQRTQFSGKVILAPRGMLKPSALQFKSFKKKGFLNLSKWLGLYKNVHFQATDKEEFSAIQQHFGKNIKVTLLGNLPAQVPPFHKKEKDTTRFLFLGRIHPIKGLDLLLKALPSADANYQLSIVGNLEDEEYWQSCQQLIKDLGLSNNISFLGPIPHPELPQVFAKHHFLVLPTLGENFGHAIFEAMSNSLPLIISDQTPWKNLEGKNAGWDLPLEISSFQNSIQKAIQMDANTYAVWSKGAWKLAKSYSEDGDLVYQYKNLFQIK